MKKFILLTAILFCCFKICQAQPGEFDSSFGTNGIITTDLGASVNYNTYGRQVLLQTDGSMYVIFQTSNQTLITKKLPNGFTDLSYGRGGFSVSVLMINAHAVMQPDGKIVVAGDTEIPYEYDYEDKYDLGIVRYNSNGSLDNTFDNDGKVTTDVGSVGNNDYVRSITIQNDGKIIVLLQSAYQFYSVLALARYNTNGSLDNTFGIDGMLLNDVLTDLDGQADANAVVILSDGKIMVAGSLISVLNNDELSDFALIRFNTDGELDFTFDGDGKQTTRFGSDNSFANTLAVQSNGKILLAGNTGGDFALVRYNTNGSLDNTFSGDGKQTTDFGSADIANSLAIQGDGKIVMAGSSFNGSNDDFEIARYNADGSPDISFSGDGKITSDLGSGDQTNSIAIQIDGKIIVTGYISDGTIYDFAVVRYNVNGSMDNSFNGGESTDRFSQGSTFYYSTAVQGDGKIVAAGITSNGNNYDFALVRYNTDGSLDNTFDGDGKQTTDFGSDDYARAVAIQGNGKIILVGSAAGDFALVRYNTDGSLDNTFSQDGKQTTDFGTDDKANSVVIQSDGKIIVGGSTVARYNSDGLPDISFGDNGSITIPFSCNDIAIQNDGKIVAVGETTVFNVARYNTDGSPDATFDDDGIQTTDFAPDHGYEYTYSRARSVAIQSDGKIVVAGYWVLNYFKIYLSNFALARYNPDGSLDNSFSDNGKQITDFGSDYADANAVTIQSDGKIVVAGSSGSGADIENRNSDFSLARFNTDGSLDKSFGDDGKKITPASGQEDFISDITIANNKLYVVGNGKFPGSLGIVGRYLVLATGSPLPVTLAGFNAKLINKAVVLNWKTFTEINSSHFDVLRSTDGIKFETIGTVAARGNSSVVIDYRLTDLSPVQGINYYRLKMVDTDGHTDYSKIINIRFAEKTTGYVMVNPNPVRGNINLRFNGLENGVYKVVVRNSSGQIHIADMIKITQSNQKMVLKPKTTLASGIYILNVRNQSGINISSNKVFVE